MNDCQFPPRPTTLAHELIRPRLRGGEWVIDATAGNGHDTLFLAEAVGPNGRVLAFDVQAAAVVATRARLEAAGLAERAEVILKSHAALAEHAPPGGVAVVMFNLGYLPGEDHAVTTESAATVAALDAAAAVLQPAGILAVVCYPGHDAGAAEARAVEDWMTERAASGWRVARYGALGTRRPAPFLLVAVK